MLTAEYRFASTPYQKVCILNNEQNCVSLQLACAAVGMSTRTYYKIENIPPTFIKPMNNEPLHQLLTVIEEFHIINEIGKAQLESNCLSGTDVRNLAQNFYLARTGHEKTFTRGWFHLFLERHKDEIGKKKKSTSVDDDRGSISINEVNAYIKAHLEALPLITDLRLFLNMDECGFGLRPEYKKRRSCVFRKSVTIPPVWKSSTDDYHVSWVCCITAAATHLRHMFITTRKRNDPDFNQTFLSNFGEFVYAFKGYMVEHNMIQWVQEILIPYVIQIRAEINNENHPVVLILDNLQQYLTSDVKRRIR